MKYELVKIETCKTTMVKSKIVTLNQYPNQWERLRGKAAEQIQYQGTPENWFRLPDFEPCDTALTRMLNNYCKK